jgi:hypothetical protein
VRRLTVRPLTCQAVGLSWALRKDSDRMAILHFRAVNARASLAVMLSENTEAQKRVAALLIR